MTQTMTGSITLGFSVSRRKNTVTKRVLKPKNFVTQFPFCDRILAIFGHKKGFKTGHKKYSHKNSHKKKGAEPAIKLIN